MATVIIREGERYARRDGGFIQICPECEEPRSGDGCCGRRFPDKPGFFITSREKPALRPRMPARCPHCGEPGTRAITIGRTMHTSRSRAENLSVELEVCAAMRTPALYYLAALVLGFAVMVCALIAAVRFIDAPASAIAPALVVLALAAAIAWLLRRYTALRLVSWGQGELRFKARARDYATELAELNGGFVAGQLSGSRGSS